MRQGPHQAEASFDAMVIPSDTAYLIHALACFVPVILADAVLGVPVVEIVY